MQHGRAATAALLLVLAALASGGDPSPAAHPKAKLVAPMADSNATLVLEKHKKLIEKSMLDTKQAIARLNGGKQAQEVTAAGDKVVEQLKSIEIKIRATADAARAKAIKARLAVAGPAAQKSLAAEGAKKLSEAQDARDEAKRLVQQSAQDKAEAHRFYRKARAALKETDAAKVAAAKANSGSRDDARYELEKALRVRKQITAMHDGSEGKLKVEVAKEKAAEVKATAAKGKAKATKVKAVQKMKVLKQKDKATLNDAKLVAKKEARELQNVGLMEVKVQSEEKTAKAKVKELKHKDQKHKAAENAELLKSKGKVKAAKAVLKLAKTEEKRTFRKERKHHRQAVRAVRDSLRRKVSVKPGVVADQGGITAARKAAFALKELKVAKMQTNQRHEEVLAATRKLTKRKIEHRFIGMKHESRRKQHAEAMKRTKKKANKGAKKALKRGKRRADREERKELRQAKRKINRKKDKAVAAAKKKMKKQIKKAVKRVDSKGAVAAAKKKKKAENIYRSKKKKRVLSAMEQKANEKAGAKINQQWSNIFKTERKGKKVDAKGKKADAKGTNGSELNLLDLSA